ncbi:alpha/beta hydrolase family protein [Nocardia sp. NPDC051030]|uniref:alpha/beta hydrolase n=1 Tax=Nocardia sp. NPDC051030 TaxID=3155162 RepID=UPI00342270A0
MLTPSVAEGTPSEGVDFVVESEMGPITSRVFRAADGSTDRVAYALEGMDAPADYSSWERNTDVAERLTAANVNVVMPIGGRATFYSDWLAPNSLNSFDCLGSTGSVDGPASPNGRTDFGSSSANGRTRLVWETFLTRDLPAALTEKYGFSSVRNGIFGVSMGGVGALNLAAHHPNQFSFVGALSSYPNISAPGMPEAIRIALAERGSIYNVDCMWGAPWNTQWRLHDPFISAPALIAANTRIYIGGGTGIPAPSDESSGSSDMSAAGDLSLGITLEVLSHLNNLSYQVRLGTLGYGNVAYDLWPIGIHSWPYWDEHVNRMLPDLIDHIGPYPRR